MLVSLSKSVRAERPKIALHGHVRIDPRLAGGRSQAGVRPLRRSRRHLKPCTPGAGVSRHAFQLVVVRVLRRWSLTDGGCTGVGAGQLEMATTPAGTLTGAWPPCRR